MYLPAEKCSVMEYFIEVVHVAIRIDILFGNHFDPFQALLGQLFAVLAVYLKKKMKLPSDKYIICHRNITLMSRKSVLGPSILKSRLF